MRPFDRYHVFLGLPARFLLFPLAVTMSSPWAYGTCPTLCTPLDRANIQAAVLSNRPTLWRVQPLPDGLAKGTLFPTPGTRPTTGKAVCIRTEHQQPVPTYRRLKAVDQPLQMGFFGFHLRKRFPCLLLGSQVFVASAVNVATNVPRRSSSAVATGSLESASTKRRAASCNAIGSTSESLLPFSVPQP